MLILFAQLDKVFQDKSFENQCGPLCLFVALSSMGYETGDFDRFVGGFVTKGPHSILDLKTRASQFGCETQVVQRDIRSLTGNVLVIAHMRKGHFLLVHGEVGDELKIVDPPSSRTVSTSDFEKEYSGYMLILDANVV